jgi:putative ABC transport system permease protein
MPSYKIEALKDISIEFRESEFVSILGPSGCGKSTLLNIIGGLDRYSFGSMSIDGISTKEFSDNHWDSYRNSTIGFVFQGYNLIPHLNVFENIELSLTISGDKKADRSKKVYQVLESVGMLTEIKRKPGQLSGGQSQRVAIARALVNDPSIVLADEPTGALDSELSLQIMELLKKISKNRLVIMVTHNRELANIFSTRIIELKDGRIIADSNPYSTSETFLTTNIDDSNNESKIIPELQDKIEKENKTEQARKQKKRNKKTIKSERKLLVQNILFRTKAEYSNVSEIPFKKVSMGFGKAIVISFRNMMTKKRRTTLTSIAGSIGIIGIALVLSLSYGYNVYIADMQSSMLSNVPIGIYEYSLDYNAAFDAMQGLTGSPKEGDFRDDEIIMLREGATEAGPASVLSLFTNSISRNKITPDLINYLKGINTNLIDGMNFIYGTRMNLVSEYYDEHGIIKYADISQVPSATTAMTIATTVLGGNGQEPPHWNQLPGNIDFISKYYDVIGGKYPENKNEIVVVVDGNNSIDIPTLEEFKIDFYQRDLNKSILTDENSDLIIRESLSFNDVIGKKFKLIHFNDYFVENDEGLFEIPESQTSLSNMYNLDNSETLEIVGVLRIKPGASTDLVGTNICYLPDLAEYVLLNAMESDICNAQRIDISNSVLKGHTMPIESDDKNIITFFMTGLQKTGYLKSIGLDPVPTYIGIYPKDFNSKTILVNLLNDYNEGLEEEYKINYFDISEMFIHNMRIAVDLITKVLISVASISLIVSCIMISIMTGNSVAERTREIGILRSIGARKLDIFSIFNAETIIIGLFSGLIAIGVSYLFIPLANYLIGVATGIFGVMILNPIHAFLLVIISFVLTFISGLIPSQMAANRNVVDALRLE